MNISDLEAFLESNIFKAKVNAMVKHVFRDVIRVVTPFVIIITCLVVWIFNAQDKNIKALEHSVDELNKTVIILENTIGLWNKSIEKFHNNNFKLK